MKSLQEQTLKERIAKLEGFLQFDPGNHLLLVELMDLAVQAREIDQARGYADRALASHPDKWQVRWRAANVAMADDRPRDAHVLLAGLQDLIGEHPVIGYHLAYAEFLCGEHAAALDTLARHPGIEQALPHAAVLRARCLHHRNEVEQALHLLTAYMAGTPGDAEALGLAALLAFDAIRLQKARKWAEEALSLDPDNLDAVVVAGCMAFEDEDMDMARGWFDRALALSPSTGRAWLGLGLVEMNAHQFEKAADALEIAIGYMPAHPGTRVTLGWCRVVMQQYAAARKVFEDAIEVNRNFSESHGGLAVVQLLLGNKEEAERSTARALRLDPNSIAGLHAQALLDGTIHDTESLDEFTHQTLERIMPRAIPRAPAERPTIH